jgi:hypothetical protein
MITAVTSVWVGWAVGSFAAILLFVLLAGLEMTVARIVQEDREQVDEDFDELGR